MVRTVLPDRIGRPRTGKSPLSITRQRRAGHQESAHGFTACPAGTRRWLCGRTPTVLGEGGERCTPNQAALHTVRIFSNFMQNISEGNRWNGRTQSGASWSPDQLRRDLRLQVETVRVEDRAEDGTLPTSREVATQLVLTLEAATSGRWAVRQVPHPPGVARSVAFRLCRAEPSRAEPSS
jgi:hypothetical protein